MIWARYKRWPFFGIVLAIIGLLIGFLFMGLLGAGAGLASGFLLGAFMGVMMGPDKGLFPVILEKWVKYGGNSPKIAGRFPCRVQTQSFPQQDAPDVESVNVEYLEGTTLRRMPNFGPPLWTRENDKPILMVLQVDRLLYLPITWDGGRLVSHRVPVYYQENGVYPTYKVAEAEDPNTKRKFLDFVRDAEGKLVPDSNGQPFVLRVEDVTMIDTNRMKDMDGKIVDVPQGLASKLNNDRSEFTRAWSVNASKYKTGGFWDKWGDKLIVIAGMCIMFLIFYFGSNNLTDANNKFTEKTGGALVMASDNVKQGAILNAQIAETLLKLGFRYNMSILCTQASNVTATVTPAPGLKIPFIGG
jgi:hypothetical protein